MKILLSNKYYYPRGGDCIYTIELEKILKEKGHEVAIFSMQHSSNLMSEFSIYFPSEIDFNQIKIRYLATSIIQPFGSSEVRKKFSRLLREFNPDIVHLNNIHSHLSPVLAQIAHKYKKPVVWTLHDYKIVCPAYLLLSNKKICEECFKCRLSVIKNVCIKRNVYASILAYLEAIFWNHKKIRKVSDVFVSPSEFLKQKMILGGLNSSRIEVIPNFFSGSKICSLQQSKENYYCYIGRLSYEKGIETLLKASVDLPQYSLKIIGTGPIEKYLKAKYNYSHIEFLGYKKWDDLQKILKGSKCLVIPSEWYENNPLSVIESLCLGTPVIGSKIGGIPELIDPGINGLLFEPFDAKDLGNKISYLWQNSSDFNSTAIATDARCKFSSDIYYEKLLKIYKSLLSFNC
jgi:glycosyltransferase involved in cell wall biosynthesis